MPADRTKCSRLSSGEDANELVWTMPTELSTHTNNIAFAPNVTPVTYNDPPPPMVDAPQFESILFPSPDNSLASRRPCHSKKKPENHIPRPPNAFILFRSSFIKSQHVSTEVETNHSTLSKIIGLTWQNLPNEERQIWHAKAKAALDEHKRKFPQYAFRPAHSKGKGGGTEKRKVREVGPKDNKRCAKIAELLVMGTKGKELNAAIQEFDKHHVPEVVTRFEAPITARMFRRSSSAPVPDDVSKQPFLSSPSLDSSRKSRASSSHPPQRSTPSLPASSLTAHDETQHHLSEPCYAVSPYDQDSFISKQDPSFDFTAFSFDPSVPMFSCAPTMPEEIGSLTSLGDMFSEIQNDVTPPHLVINTSFVDMDTWSHCSSPLSSPPSSIPTTPSYLDSPSQGPYDSFSIGPFGHRSFDDDLCQFSSSCPSPFIGRDAFHNPPYQFASFEQECKIHMAHLDLDLSAFMASLPQYTN